MAIADGERSLGTWSRAASRAPGQPGPPLTPATAGSADAAAAADLGERSAGNRCSLDASLDGGAPLHVVLEERWRKCISFEAAPAQQRPRGRPIEAYRPARMEVLHARLEERQRRWIRIGVRARLPWTPGGSAAAQLP
ncbi:hypothetical protein PVAP13_9NG037573 [Panicum virgatum]|uniref:Uncharacterized protein n=1 Tax=Panicum virgatum TaxID=38727 RepID=A0A8T0MCH1_PANVG|nr:hypothetical protein PVAP13_9NG037573 [Panicum virgatum]